MMKKLWLLVIILLFSSYVYAVECGSTPTNGCTISTHTTFNPGEYYLPSGISFANKYAQLDCNGAHIYGAGSGKGIGVDDWEKTDYNVIKNCKISDYEYGVYIGDAIFGDYISSIEVSDNEIYNNTYGIFYYMATLFSDVKRNVFRENNYAIYQDLLIDKDDSFLYFNLDHRIYDNDFYDSGVVYKYTKGIQFCSNGVPNRWHGFEGPQCDCIVPISNSYISEDRKLCYGTYNVHDIGFMAKNADLDCQGSTLIGPGSGKGIKVDDWELTDNNVIKNCNLQDYESAIYIGDNVLGDHLAGNQIIDNTISGSTYGVNMFYATKDNIINYNTFYDNNRAIYFGNNYVQASTINYNDFYSNIYNVYNTQPYSINSENNWWGLDDVNYIQDKIYDCSDGSVGCVDYTPWLTVGPEDRMVDLVINDITFNQGSITVQVYNNGSYDVRDLKLSVIEKNGNQLVQEIKYSYLNTISAYATINIVISMDVTKDNEVIVVLDPDNEVVEREKANNVLSKLYQGVIKLWMDTDVPPGVANTEIQNYIIENMGPVEFVESDDDAEVLIYVARHNPVVVWQFEAQKNEGWIYYGNFLLKDGEIDDAPYAGLVGSFTREGQKYIGIIGNDIEGFILGAKEFIKQKDLFLNTDTARIFGKSNIEGLAIYDYLHSDGVRTHYKENTEEFGLAVSNALTGRMSGESLVNIDVDGVSYRIKRIESANSALMKEYLDPDGYPVVMGGGLWSNVDAWDDLGNELANEGKDVYLIELTGGPSEEEENNDYTYEYLQDVVFPAYVNYVKTDSSSSRIKYVGHSNGARVALTSLTQGAVNPTDVDTLVLVGVPGAFSELSYFAELVDEGGAEAIQSLRDDNEEHVTFSEIGFRLDNLVSGLASFFSSVKGDEKKISLNLFEKYFDWISSNSDSQPGNGLNIDSFSLIYGNDGFGNSNSDDFIVAVDDELAIYNNVQGNNKAIVQLPVKHVGMPADEQVKEKVKESISKSIY